MKTAFPKLSLVIPLLASAVLLAACGGGDTSTSATPAAGSGSGAGAGSGAGSGSLVMSASTPASADGTVDPSQATSATNTATAANPGVPSAYCDVEITSAKSTNGKSYDVKVYFRQSDQKVLNVSVMESGALGFVANLTDVTNGITGVTITLATRTATFTNAALAGTDIMSSAATATTLNGSVVFPASGVAACGT